MSETATRTILEPGVWSAPAPGTTITGRVAVIGKPSRASAWTGEATAWASLQRFDDAQSFVAANDSALFDAIVDEGEDDVAARIELLFRALDALAPGGLYVGLAPALRTAGSEAVSETPRHESLLDCAIAVAAEIAGEAAPVRAIGSVAETASPDLVRQTLLATIARIELGDGVLRIVKRADARAPATTLHGGDVAPGPFAALRAGDAAEASVLRDHVAALSAETARLRLRVRRFEADHQAWAERTHAIESSWLATTGRAVRTPMHLRGAVKVGAFNVARRAYRASLRIPLLRGLAARARALLR